VAVPVEDGKMSITSGMQEPTLLQNAISVGLGMPRHKIDVRVRRTGGAYGGKLFHNVPTSVVAALAAKKVGLPVRMHNERAADMAGTGGRSPMTASWSAAVDPATKVISSSFMSLTFNSGCVDGGTGDVGMALQWSDNCYRHHDFSAAASIVNTPLPVNCPTPVHKLHLPRSTPLVPAPSRPPPARRDSSRWCLLPHMRPSDPGGGRCGACPALCV
jgi:xanthine dehydrogenase molybdopterin-binding subunit B